jgi:transcriptional regulator with XRE-family HTH domain
MPPVMTNDTRRSAFAAFVRRALRHAAIQRDLKRVEDVADASGVGASTIYRWLAEQINEPKPEQVRAFCLATGVQPSVAFGILWPDEGTGTRSRADLAVMDEDVQALLARLTDPSLSDEERQLLRRMIRALGSGPPAGQVDVG